MSSDRVVPLVTGWSWCASRPGAWVSPQAALAQSDASRWQRAAGLGVAGSLLHTASPGSLPAPDRLDSVDWWWRCRVALPDALPTWWLESDGLATLAEVWLRDPVSGDEVRLFSSRNMFLSHRVWLPTGTGKATSTELWLCLRSVEAALAARRPRPGWRVPMVNHQQLRWLRTTLLGRTPGWSPPVAPVGAWRPMRLVRRAIQPLAPQWHASVEGSEGVVSLRMRFAEAVELVELALVRGEAVHRVRLTGAADGAWQGELRVPQPVLWWPHTHGEPALYEARLVVRAQDGGVHQMKLGPVGFRRVEVETADGDFQVRVNGVPVFCRGAVWTPLDVVRWRDRPAAVRDAVAQARSAGMNMLRVAGTMVYESAAFLDACDAEGVLVWQDFMFANMDYPASDAAWQADALREVRQQLDQWQARACLAVVCGNSEVQQQAAMWGAERSRWSPAWFEQAVREAVGQALPMTFYWPSSASGGAFPHQADSGTTSYYGVGAYRRDLQDARCSGLRFATECLAIAQPPDAAGLARMPGGAALRVHHPGWKARVPRDLGAGWDFDDVRDHYLGRLFETDPAALRQRDHDRYLRWSRITCAELLAGTMAEWRRVGSACRGALVLWLRDLWAGAGWGVLDERGRPKAAWHPLRRVQQPVVVLVSDEGLNGLCLHLHNEGPQPVSARLVVTVWQSHAAREEAETDLVLLPHSARSLPVLALFGHFTDLSDAYRFGPLAHRATQARLLDPAGAVLAEHWHLAPGWAAAASRGLAEDTGLAVTACRALAPDLVLLELTVQRLALFVHFEVPGWWPDDDHFHLPPGRPRQVRLRRNVPDEGPTDAEVWQGWIHSLNGDRPTAIPAPQGKETP